MHQVEWKPTGPGFQGSSPFFSCVTTDRLTNLSEPGVLTCKAWMHLLCRAVMRGKNSVWSVDSAVPCPDALQQLLLFLHTLPHVQWAFSSTTCTCHSQRTTLKPLEALPSYTHNLEVPAGLLPLPPGQPQAPDRQDWEYTSPAPVPQVGTTWKCN